MHLERSERQHAAMRAAILLAAALLVTLAVLVTLDDRLRERNRSAFDEGATRIAGEVEAQLESYLDELRGVGAYLLARGAPPTDEVAAFVREARIFEHADSLGGVLVLVRVTDDDVAAFETEMRSVDPAFRILGIGEAPSASPHFVVTHNVPGDIDLPLPRGLDIAAVEGISRELEARGLAGEATAGALLEHPEVRALTERFDPALAQRLREQVDFFIGVPVYPLDGDEPSDGMPVAWVAAPVGGFDAALDAMVADESGSFGVRLTVPLDSAVRGSEPVERIADRRGDAGDPAAASFGRVVRLDVSGLEVSVTVWSSPRANGSDPDVLLVVGLALVLASISAAGLAYLRVVGRHRALALARMRTLHEQIALQDDILASVDDAVVVLDRDARVVAGNRAWEQLRAHMPSTGDDPIGRHRPYLDLIRVSPAAEAWITQAFDAVLAGDRERIEIDLRMQGDEERTWSWVRITPLHADPGGLVVVHGDITERKRAEEDMARRATHDQLTGLLNRAGLEEGIRSILERAQSNQVPVAALFIDLDDFKEINDTYGHAVGDAVLRLVARRISGAVRAADLVARMGGDEFVVLLLDPLGGGATALGTAERILAVMQDPMRAAGVELRVAASIGVVVVADATDVSPGALVQRADDAMYDAKREGGARFTFVDA